MCIDILDKAKTSTEKYPDLELIKGFTEPCNFIKGLYTSKKGRENSPPFSSNMCLGD
jgi:hypothetical protein